MPQHQIIRYQASASDAKYIGVNIKAFTDNLRVDVIKPILKKYHVSEINPGEWMPAQTQLDMLREIEAQFSWEELVAIGVKSGEYFPLPPEIDSIEKFLEANPQMYQMILRDGSPDERITVEKIGLNHYQLTLNSPVPPFVMYGGAYAILKRLGKDGQDPTIAIVQEGTPYIFDVKW